MSYVVVENAPGGRVMQAPSQIESATILWYRKHRLVRAYARERGAA